MRLIMRTRKTVCRFFAALTAMLLPSMALAQDDLNGANTAWILTSTALVLFMTLPVSRCSTVAWSEPKTFCPS